MKKHYCPTCESKLSEEFVMDLSMCTKCGHIFKNKTVDKKHYVNYMNSACRGDNESAINLAQLTSEQRYGFVISFSHVGKLLEVGCGHRYFLERSEASFDVSGVELSTPIFEKLSKDFDMYNGTPSNITDLKEYDVICLFNVLEKMNKPIEEIRQLVLHMKDDGKMFIEMPALMFIGLEFDPRKIYDGLQTQYFNPMSINMFLQKCGLKIVEQKNFWVNNNVSNTLMCLKKDNNSEELK